MLVTTITAKLTRQDVPDICLQMSQSQLEMLVGLTGQRSNQSSSGEDQFFQNLFEVKEAAKGNRKPLICDHR